MPGLIYFIPNCPSVSEADLKRLDLQDILGPASPPHQGGQGPEGVAGRFTWVRGSLAEGEEVEYAVHDAAKQTWFKCRGGEYWIGFWNDRKPGPEQLARPAGYGGYDVLLGDGNKWRIPVARLISGGTTFASKMTLDDAGKWIVGGVENRFADLCARAGVLLETLDEKEDGQEVSDAEAMQLAIDALAANYYIGKWEAAALELLTDFNAEAMTADSILGALIDLPTIMSLVKKNSEFASTDGGDKG